MSFYKTKLTIEVECETQFGPHDAMDMVGHLLNVPAITMIRINKAKSDYKRQTKEDTQANAMERLPLRMK
jgi:hypothetical protein